jgi:hypothetical protein
MRDQARRDIERELREIADVRTEEELILYRLGLTPRFPVTRKDVSALREKYGVRRREVQIACAAVDAQAAPAQFSAPLQRALVPAQGQQGHGSAAAVDSQPGHAGQTRPG